MDRRAMGLLALAHLADDLNQSFLPAVLPLLIISYSLSYQAAGTLILAAAICSSVVQPAIGYLADRRSMPWLIPLGLLLAGGGVAVIGFLPSFGAMFFAAALSGLGVAMFHPEAARYANYTAGAKKATGMRWFALGGNIGFAVGPIIATAALAAFAVHGTMFAVIPAAVVAVALVLELPRLQTFHPGPRAKQRSAAPDRWGPFSRLTAYVMLRSSVYVGTLAFIPLFFINVLHATHALGNFALTLYLLMGAVGTITGGPLADRFGRRAVMIASCAGAALAFLAFAFAPNGIAALLAVGAAGFIMVMSQTAFVVLGQEYLPNRLGIASGVTMGLAVSVGGMMSPVFGAIADRSGLERAFECAALLAALAMIVALTLPRERVGQAIEGTPSAA